jgi:hypothetical protein
MQPKIAFKALRHSTAAHHPQAMTPIARASSDSRVGALRSGCGGLSCIELLKINVLSGRLWNDVTYFPLLPGDFGYLTRFSPSRKYLMPAKNTSVEITV